MDEPEPADSARVIAEDLCELINASARIIQPERFEALSSADLSEVHALVGRLREALEGFTGWVSPELNVAELRAVLPDLQGTLLAESTPERVAAARAFLTIAMGSENLQVLLKTE